MLLVALRSPYLLRIEFIFVCTFRELSHEFFMTSTFSNVTPHRVMAHSLRSSVLDYATQCEQERTRSISALSSAPSFLQTPISNLTTKRLARELGLTLLWSERGKRRVENVGAESIVEFMYN